MQRISIVIARAVGALAAVVLSFAFLPSVGFAAGPEFVINRPAPDTALPGEAIGMPLSIQNVGDARSQGPITITDITSPGLTAVELGSEGFVDSVDPFNPPENSDETPQPPVCNTVGRTTTCTIAESLAPGVQLSTGIIVPAFVEPGAIGSVSDHVTVSGGGAPTVSSDWTIDLAAPQPFGVSDFGVSLADPTEVPVAQAGADPSDFTTTLRFQSFAGIFAGFAPLTFTVQHFKDVTTHLPVGFVGNPTAVPVCTAAQLVEVPSPGSELPNCSPESQVGLARVSLAGVHFIAGLYNMEAPPGAATQLGFKIEGVVITLDAYVRPGDHGIDVVSRDTNTTLPITGVEIDVWGDPAAKSHDRYRGSCLGRLTGADGHVCPSGAPEKAFLRMPTSCSGEGISFGVDSNSYEEPGHFVQAGFGGPALTGCGRVPFSPTIFVQPTTTAANSPAGVAVQLSLPQNENPEGLGEADLKKAVVTLPEGMALNPSAADGLQACLDAQFGVDQAGPSECPDGSKVGRVLLHTPLLESPIEGTVYVLSQESSDPESGRMFRIGMELRDDRHGIDIKVPGQISVNKNTGRLTTTFDDNPQLPFSDITLHFKSGARAPLVTPAACEPQTTEADLYSWAEPTVAVHRNMTFNLTAGPEGSACTTSSPFDPGFSAGVTSVQAGGFTPFLTTFTRKDADQSMQRVSVKLPLGVSGSLAGLPLCPEALASVGRCEPSSEIGTVTAGAGAGPTPFYVTGGHVYMTGPYEGAPFGLSVVVPAKAGPFDLGNVNVRAKVEVDPYTAQLTVTTDPLPQIVGGVPVNLRLVNVTINRPNFTFNPTSCEPLSVEGAITGGQGAVVDVSNHFQVTNCGALAFKPSFKVSTSAKTSRTNGASLHVRLAYPAGSLGHETNIGLVKVELPRQLPSRLSTLQKACTAAQFESNPAGCPPASIVGHAKAITPIIPVPLEGPAYFVSHGGEAFPSLIIVLQGYGVTVDLVGTTFISKQGITSSTFKTVPDVPVGTFELTLPEGPYSALTTAGSLCKGTLTMPTTLQAQNGAEIHQATKITVAGCPKAKKKTTHKKRNAAHERTKTPRSR